MKSNYISTKSNTRCLVNLFNNTILLLSIFIIYILGLILYNKYVLNITNNNTKNTTNTKLISNPTLKEIRNLDRFIDVVLNDLGSLNTSIPSENLTENELYKLNYYNTYFNNTTKNSIKEFVDTNINDIDSRNLIHVQTNYNIVKEKLNTILENLNTQLLKQLQKNYAIAHKINTKRNIDLEDIDYLPQRFD